MRLYVKLSKINASKNALVCTEEDYKLMGYSQKDTMLLKDAYGEFWDNLMCCCKIIFS